MSNAFLHVWDKSFTLSYYLFIPASVFLLFIIDWTDWLPRRQKITMFITIFWFILHWTVFTVGLMFWDWSRPVIIILIAPTQTVVQPLDVSAASQNQTNICNTVRFMNEIWVVFSDVFINNCSVFTNKYWKYWKITW